MAKFQIFRETVLPSSLEPYALYLVAPPSKPDYIELYATDSTGSATRKIIDQEDIENLINNALANISSLEVVADIAERDALNPISNTHVYVLDASADPTVNGGSASYIYQHSTNTWYKYSESESLDLNLTWDKIIGRPTSTPTQIDNAIENSHNHSNKTQLDKIDEDIDGNFIYNGKMPVIEWSSVEW